MISDRSDGRQRDRSRAFRIHLIVFLSVQCAIAAVVVHHGGSASSQHYLAAFQDKLQQLESASGPRLIFVGGSSVAFGVNSEVAAAATGRSPVNLGLYYPLGLDYQLAMIRRHGRPGDCVVILPELEAFEDSLLPQSPSSVEELVHLNDDAAFYFGRQDATDWKRFFDVTSLEIAHRFVGRAYEAVTRSQRERLYARESFNRFGDMTAHRCKPAIPGFNLQPIGLDDEAAIERSIAKLNRFADQCRQNNIEVLFSYPPMPHDRQVASAEQLARFEACIDARLTFPVLQSMDEVTYPIEAFHDTVYHLSAEQAKVRTADLTDAMVRLAATQTPPMHR